MRCSYGKKLYLLHHYKERGLPWDTSIFTLTVEKKLCHSLVSTLTQSKKLWRKRSKKNKELQDWILPSWESKTHVHLFCWRQRVICPKLSEHDSQRNFFRSTKIAFLQKFTETSFRVSPRQTLFRSCRGLFRGTFCNFATRNSSKN